VPHLGIDLITVCRPSLDPLNISCTVPLRLGVAVSGRSSSSSYQCCTALDRARVQMKCATFWYERPLFSIEPFFSMCGPSFWWATLLFHVLWWHGSFRFLGKLCYLRQPSFVLSAIGTEMLFLHFALNWIFSSRALVDSKMVLLTVDSILVCMYACMLTDLQCPLMERPISVLASLRGHPLTDTPCGVGAWQLAHWGPIGVNQQQGFACAVPRVPPGFIPK